MKNPIRLLFAGLLISLTFTSCLKDKFDVNEMGTNQWDPDMAIPVVNTSLTMLNITQEMEKTTFGIDDDNLVSIIYTEEIFTHFAEDLITFPDQVLDTTIIWDYPIGVPVGDSATQNYIYTKEIKTFSGEVVDTVYFKQGTISYRIETDVNHDGKMIITIPGMVKNGKPFKATLIYDYTGSLPQVITATYDISGYRAVFSHSGKKNYLNSQVKVVGYGDNNPIYSPYEYQLESRFENINFSKIYGYFSQYQFDLNEDSLEVTVYDNKDYGQFQFEDPCLNLRFYNSFGMPIEGQIKELKTYRAPQEVEITKLSGAPLDNIAIDYPLLSQIGDVVITEKIFDKNNSTIKDALDIDPQWIIFNVDGRSNPSGNTYNFALDTSRLTLETEMEFPLHGTSAGLVLRDTIAYDLSDDLDKDGDLKTAEMQVYMKNGLPVEAQLQIYFTDSNYVVLDSLFMGGPESVMLAADPGPAPGYRVKNPTEKRSYIKLDRAKIDNIIDARKALVKIISYTSGYGMNTVKIYSDYQIDVKIGVRAKYETEF